MTLLFVIFFLCRGYPTDLAMSWSWLSLSSSIFITAIWTGNVILVFRSWSLDFSFGLQIVYVLSDFVFLIWNPRFRILRKHFQTKFLWIFASKFRPQSGPLTLSFICWEKIAEK